MSEAAGNLSEQDKLFLAKYGRLPPKKAALGQRMKGGDRKYFDSGDYAMSKAGKSEPGAAVGSQHPSPERIPHSIPQNMKKNDITNSPVKESGLTHEAGEVKFEGELEPAPAALSE